MTFQVGFIGERLSTQCWSTPISTTMEPIWYLLLYSQG